VCDIVLSNALKRFLQEIHRVRKQFLKGRKGFATNTLKSFVGQDILSIARIVNDCGQNGKLRRARNLNSQRENGKTSLLA
jgi:hypothetical protein